ncbi:MAG: energy coupling factor transporter S component ThiW [Candidatus Bathyarchaeia archaeon]|nr:energy coupling factor transporter S component ThiW [Candidatus Bathyarchaeota archaeon]
MNMNSKAINIKKLSLITVFSALGVVVSPYTWFIVFGTKANPAQHMINAVLGVMVGPLWAAVSAVLIGIIRNLLGIGTIYAFPGGVPGGIVVGLVYEALRRLGRSERMALVAALFEPLGTLLIGAPLALFLVAPWLGTKSLLDLISNQGLVPAYFTFSFGWAASCLSGSVIGFFLLLVLKNIGISRENLFDQK